VLALVVALAAAPAAGASPGSRYRARVRALCEANTPRLLELQKQAAADGRAGKARAWAMDLAFILRADVEQDREIYAVPLPRSASWMDPILERLHALDTMIRRLSFSGSRLKLAQLEARVGRIAAASVAVNRLLDRNGLRACGSAQVSRGSP
jgi:hypothetical protein